MSGNEGPRRRIDKRVRTSAGSLPHCRAANLTALDLQSLGIHVALRK